MHCLNKLKKKYEWNQFLYDKWGVTGKLEYSDQGRSIVCIIRLLNIMTDESKIVAAADVRDFLTDEVVLNEVIHDFFYDYKKSIPYIRKALETAEELNEAYC